MGHEEQVGKNFAWGALSQIVTRLFGLAFFVFMSYVLHEKGMGQYNFVTSFVPFWLMFSDFGITGYLYREWSKGTFGIEKIKHDFNTILTLKFIVSCAIFIPFCIANWYLNRDIFFALILFYIFTFLSTIISHAEAYLTSANNFKLGAIRLLIEKFTIIIIGGLLLFLFPDVISVFVAMIVSQLAAIYYYFLGRFPFRPSIIFNWQRVRELLVKGVPFILYGIFYSVYARIDMVMLKFMQNFEAVGWYGAGYKVYELANIFPGVLFIPAIFPVLSRIYNLESRERYRDFMNRALRILFTSSILLSAFFIVFAPHVIGWFFPASFSPSILVMRIIVLVLTLSSLSALFNSLLLIQNKEKIILKIILVSCCANILLNFILIPMYSLYGAAWATVLAEMINLFLLQYFADWDKDKKILLISAVVVIFSAISFFVIRLFGYSNNLFVGVVNIMIILGLVWVAGLINKNDLRMFYLPFKNKFRSLFFNQNEV